MSIWQSNFGNIYYILINDILNTYKIWSLIIIIYILVNFDIQKIDIPNHKSRNM